VSIRIVITCQDCLSFPIPASDLRSDYGVGDYKP
jgi:hypothetical protein